MNILEKIDRYLNEKTSMKKQIKMYSSIIIDQIDWKKLQKSISDKLKTEVNDKTADKISKNFIAALEHDKGFGIENSVKKSLDSAIKSM